MKIIAIDGPAGSGKGTVSQYIAEKLNFAVIDTGLFYRALGLRVVKYKIALDDESRILEQAKQIELTELDDPNLRSEETASTASKTSVFSSVRNVITQKIRDEVLSLEQKYPGAVVDGRDVATAIFPDADVKLFITADADIRAQRRALEMNKNDKDAYIETITERDARDTKRKASPLLKVGDAFEINTTYLAIPDVCNQALEYIFKKI